MFEIKSGTGLRWLPSTLNSNQGCYSHNSHFGSSAVLLTSHSDKGIDLSAQLSSMKLCGWLNWAIRGIWIGNKYLSSKQVPSLLWPLQESLVQSRRSRRLICFTADAQKRVFVRSTGLHSHTHEGQDVGLPQGAESRSARRREEGDEDHVVSNLLLLLTTTSRIEAPQLRQTGSVLTGYRRGLGSKLHAWFKL